MESQFEFFEVGGAVRDSLMGLNSKDVDFSVVAQPGLFNDAATAFAALENHLTEQGFKIFESRAEFLTIRAQVAAGHPLLARTKVADFVLAHQQAALDAAYQRSDLLEERREVLERWARYVTAG